MNTFIRRPIRLSKSRFLSGSQCDKRLYYEVFCSEYASKIDNQRQAMLDMGTEIGDTARLCFPGGQLVSESYRQSSAALERTAKLIADPEVPAIFEAAFQYAGTLIRVDILERSGGQSWSLIEVKASSRVKAIHKLDLAVQAYILQGSGIVLSQVCLMHMNRHYVFQGGEVDLQSLFVREDLTEEVLPRLSKIPGQLDHFRQILSKDSPPDIPPDSHCHTPYECPFWDHCTKEKSERWVFYLPGAKDVVKRMMKQGIEHIDEIPVSYTHLTLPTKA